MELEELTNIETKSCVILCLKCLAKGEYTIPSLELNELNEIVYKCTKKHFINKNDISYTLLNEKIKTNLTRCQNENHLYNFQGQDNIFCAWCEKCAKNICQVDVAVDLKRGHNYILYMQIIPDDSTLLFIREKINKLKELINKYNTLCPNEKDDINFLIKTYNRNYMNYNLYNNENIINYQTINNLLFNCYDGFSDEVFEYLENNYIKKRYIFLYKEILNKKSASKIKKTEINLGIDTDYKFIPLIQDNKILAYLYFQNNYSEININIYDNKGKIINIIKDQSYINELEILPVKSDVIIISNPIYIIILYFYNNYCNYYKKKLFFILNNLQMFYSKKISWNTKFIKTSSNIFIYLLRGFAYSIPLSEHLEYNCNSNINEDTLVPLNAEKQYIWCINSVYYRNNENILEGVVMASISYQDDFKLSDKCEIKLLDEKLNAIMQMEFNYELNKKINIQKAYDINYNYLNNMIIFFINDEIYQINVNTKQVVTIYNISKYIPFKKILFFYHYNDNINNLEQIIILISKKDVDNIILYNWDEKSLLLKKKYTLPDIKDIYILFTPHISKNTENNNSDEIIKEKKFDESLLFIESNNLIIFS